ncbi:MAG TPA: hypothetical protein ENL03_04845 [Phycisphaerae bacterium]|nr:hypothetical protein [Phycisphaerae bacterium]
MAIGFFRRHKKLMIGIMVVLMLSFGGGTVITQLFSGKDRSEDFVTHKISNPVSKITRGDTKRADYDISLLRRMGIGGTAWQILNGNENQGKIGLIYAVLLKEAEKSGMVATNADLDTLIKQVGMNTDMATALDTIQSRLSDDDKRSSVGDEEILSAASRWIGVIKTMQLAIPRLPISTAEVELVYRDAMEGMKLWMVAVPAREYLDKVPAIDPSALSEQQAKEIKDLFQAHKNSVPNRYADENDAGYGYLIPRHVRLHYILLDSDVIDRICAPFRSEIQKEYTDNKHDYTKNEDSENGADSEEGAGPKKVPMTFSEAREKIIGKLKREKSAKTMADLEDTLMEMLIRYNKDDDPGAIAGAGIAEGRAYDWAMEQMVEDATDNLKTRLSISIDRETVKDAIDKLSEDANVRICYPFGPNLIKDSKSGKYSEVKIDGDVIVTLAKEDCRTLGDALTALAKELSIDEIDMNWKRCSGIDAIFPAAAKSLFPLERSTAGYGRTKLVSKKDIEVDALLRSCRSKTNEKLSDLALRVGAKEAGESKDIPQLDFDGTMNAGYRGRLIWRVTQVVKAHALKGDMPTGFTLYQVIDDWKKTQAFELALRDLSDIKDIKKLNHYIEVHDTNAALPEVDGDKLNQVTTSMFSRLLARERNIRDFASIGAPTDIVETRHPQYGFMYPQEQTNVMVQKYMVRQAVAKLTPKDPDDVFGKKSEEVVMIPLRSTGIIVFAQRVDYIPVVESEFEANKMRFIASHTTQVVRELVIQWLSYDGVVARTGLRMAPDED